MAVSRRGLFAGAAVLVLGFAGIGGYAAMKPRLEDQARVETSDASKRKGTIAVGVDNVIGYYPLCSPHLQTQMRNDGWDVQCKEDDADYAKRVESLRKGEIQFMVATVDAYLLNGGATSFPGSIVMVIDESKGADAIVARASKVKNIDDIKAAGPTLKVVFTPKSPSEHLLKASAAHFDIPGWRNAARGSRVEASGSADAAKRFLKGEADVAVLWEPDITKLLKGNPDVVKVIGTENTSRLIVDVLIVRREFAKEHQDAVEALLQAYFKSLAHYRNNPAEGEAQAARFGKIEKALVRSAMDGVSWQTLVDNAQLWMGVDYGGQKQYGLIDAVEATMRILQDSGDFTKNPLPREDPRSIVWSEFVDNVYKRGAAGFGPKGTPPQDSLTREFPELTDAQWKVLREVGTLRMRPILFPRASSELSVDSKENIDRIVDTLKVYPHFRILIEGHTSTRGDPDINLELSQERADAVARYLQVTYGVSQHRIQALGVGGSQPLPQSGGETDREYNDRLPRVLFKLMAEAL